MRDFIKKQIQERMNVASKNNEPEEVTNEAVLEYASLFQELDDLSLEGTESGNVRKLGIDIPLDEEAEIESVEFDIGNGKVKDIPNTASIQESYTGIKTFNEFYQEAYESMTRLPRESDGGFERRVEEYAESVYKEYCAESEACGYFGFDKINIADERVPSKINVNFGSMNDGSNDNFVTKVNTFFATDDEHNITQKQLDSVSLIKNGALKNIGSSLKAYMESNYDVASETSVWDVCTPKTLIVPKGNNDSFCVVVEYTNEITGKNEYFGWTAPVTDTDEVTMESCEKYNMASFVNETQYENHDKYIQEATKVEMEERMTRRVRPSRFFQEAIDLGGEGGDANADSNATPDANAGATEGGDAPADTSTTDAGATDDTTSTESGENKETAAVNNVSTEIAEKVANDTQNDAMSDDEQVTFSDDEVNPDSNVNEPDAGSIDEEPVEAGVTGDESTEGDDADDMLNDLDTGSSTDTDVDDMGDESLDETSDELPSTDNIDDMSVNDLLKLGTESLKNMKVGDLKNLIASGDNDAIQEAFIITSKNINKEIDIKLRNCCGILNSNQLKADKLFNKFKIEGHKLNRLLSKGIKMNKVYSTNEVEILKKLNTTLADLLVAIRKDKKSENYATVVKGKISEFTKAAKPVAALVEEKMGKQNEQVLQEQFIQEGLFLSSGNVKKRLSRKLPPVYADMMSIAKLAEQGALAKGKLIKMYKPSKRTSTISYNPGYEGGFGNSRSREYDVNTPQSENINDLQRTLSKIIRKPKVQQAFTSDEMNKISDLIDRIDDFVDMVESIIYDNSSSDNKALLEKIGELAGKIVDLIKDISNFCSLGEFSTSHKTFATPEETSVDSKEDEIIPDGANPEKEDDDEEEEFEIPTDDDDIETEPTKSDDDEDEEKEDEE